MNIAPARSFVFAAAAVLIAALSACNTTTLDSSWKAPEVGSITFTKILIIGIAPVDSLRRPIEDSIKAQITAVPAVTSYELLPKVEDQVDPKKVAEAIKTGGFDGIITMRMISLDTEETYHPGGMMPAPYTSFYGYYSPSYALAPYYRGMHGVGYGAGYGGYGMSMAYEYVPPSVSKEVFMSIETNIYNAKDGKLIWTGLTKTKNPNDSENLIKDVGALVKAKLKEQRLI